MVNYVQYAGVKPDFSTTLMIGHETVESEIFHDLATDHAYCHDKFSNF